MLIRKISKILLYEVFVSRQIQINGILPYIKYKIAYRRY